MQSTMQRAGHCPYCYNVMEGTNSISWGDKTYEFPRLLFKCNLHGFFMWKGMEGNVFIAPWEFEREAREAKQKPPAVPPVDPTICIIKVLCESCNIEWRMTQNSDAEGRTQCPQCLAILPIDKGVQEIPPKKSETLDG